ncbi:hypothetical protein AB0I81_03900 [Nonomuraea sp. NPDC050404]|uniref:hypothetical protein n=1 Tax=Nonomuraea sp. NPDC050404 TaxID=3155783 RepID=UPI0033E8A1D8
MVKRKRSAQRIDVTRLPEDIVTLLDALEPGENLVLTRDGEAIATISSTIEVLQGSIVDRAAPEEADEPDEAGDEGPIDYDGVTVVATAMELSAAARVALSDQLGEDYVVLDLHAAPTTADVLLVPPGSPQLIGGLKSMYPEARVIITEIEDPELGVNYHGPVRRLLEAGADAYLPPATLPRLARQLDYTLTHADQLTAGNTAPLQIAPADPDDGRQVS